MCMTELAHVTIQCSVDDPVDLGTFSHIAWKYFDDPESEREEEAESESEEEEEDFDDALFSQTNTNTSQRSSHSTIESPVQGEAALLASASASAETAAPAWISQAHAEAKPSAFQGAFFSEAPAEPTPAASRGAGAEVAPGAVATNEEAEAMNMMLGPIPYNMRKEEIVQVLNEQGFRDKCLDVHMPENTNSKCRNENVGCVFVTFRNSTDADEFRRVFNGFLFAGSERPCEVKLAHLQGVFPTRWSRSKHGRSNRSENRRHSGSNYSNTSSSASSSRPQRSQGQSSQQPARGSRVAPR
mmetsp:Transcript_155321/g.289762  ORF Transcript_155321/g.289762 Transcript_155321/m.289762 type:complete len:299 (+) Transcript_155321:60-956(+)